MPEAGSTSTAFCGQTEAQGVLSPHCWHIIGTKAAPGGRPGSSILWTRSQVMPLRSVARSAAGGTLFSTAQATTQAPQPLHRSRSMTIP